MSPDEIVDPSVAPSDQFRRFVTHVGIPVAGVLMVIAVIAGVGWHSYRTVRNGALSLTHSLLLSQQEYVGNEVNNFLAPASAGAVIARDMLMHGNPTVEDKIFYGYSSSMLRNVPQIQSYYLADSDGNFSLVQRGPDNKGLEQISLQNKGTPDATFVHHIFDDNGKLVSEQKTKANGYDPRLHVWYQQAVKAGKMVWTPPYIVEVTKQMAISAGMPYTTASGKTYVYAINMSLSHLTDFLDALKIGQSGHGVLLDQSGHVLAGHKMHEIEVAAHGDPEKMLLDPVHYPVMSKAFDQYRVHSYGTRTLRNKGQNYITMLSPVPLASQNWVLMLVAPESDFAQFAKADGRQNLFFAFLVVIMSSILAVLLFRQGRKTEHVQHDLERFRAISNYESHSLQTVASYPELFNPSDDALILTESLVDLSQARRAGIWRILHDGATLMCIDSYDRQQDAHSGGFELSTSELKTFFDAVSHGDSLLVADASTDERTANFYRLYMRSMGSHSLFLGPILGANGPVGVITLEDAPQAALVTHFVDMIAGIAATRFSAQHYSAVEAARAELAENEKVEEEAPDASQGFLVPPGSLKVDGAYPLDVDPSKLEGFYPAVAIMVISLSDMVLTSQNDPSENLKLIDAMAQQLQQIAHHYGLYSIRMLGHRLVCVAGCSKTPDKSAPQRMANAALSMREVTMSMLAKADLDPVFRIGIDVGPVFGGLLGQEPRVFNLWGDAMGMAELMAQGAPDAGTIQVTEEMYLSLRQSFLFRERGRFFVPGLGLTRTYVLAGRR
ncbi:GAF domain-containing protein [Novacetimonas hansenii]|uniref:GAF domain-containing protein n=2 Tax=Novacetimonas hansenii TaxID=436 RepID=A0AAW5ENS9_NOVHA|nr:adenylate/guanylate cyclase domain-containing protein [Novacetimonas hansenii]EFG85090.1 adenylate/guanylate cyclase [Novacetimonas hansenii ATCC 23769]MBL7235737.1 GAF domain-containing protein [Novacetimonas hansenii]MCJ8352508.1 GAF domain-containing protein [Novacetimonas hansenii]PYD73664.1 adenylate/guanylate cyclase domain-containing protein [Novacetimonas hansenii]QOF94544.1 GAF domain-containing protein [Novacetimonas hansenii]